MIRRSAPVSPLFLVLLSAALAAACSDTPEGKATLTARSPADGATNVPLDAVISFTLSAPIDPLSIQGLSLQLAPAVDGALSLNGATVSFTPTEPLVLHTHYVAVVSPSVRDSAGNAVGPGVSWSFDTSP